MSSKSAVTKNDAAWDILFERHNILQSITAHGFHKIKAVDIKKEREPRLMCKFDHRANLAKPFKENQLSILPVSRSEYIIGKFDTFHEVKYQEPEPKRIPFPSLDSIRRDTLYSEAASLHAAAISGMFQDLLGLTQDASFYQTISGRMGSGTFDFSISSGTASQRIQVVNSQIEIDGGYEGQHHLLLIEAKKEAVSDFNIRQLYYPYRTWQSRIGKKVIPAFFTLSNDVFSFFVYDFTDPGRFDSLKLIKQQDYMLTEEHITMQELIDLARRTETTPEAAALGPFPQADELERVIDLLSLLYERPYKKEELTENYDFTSRQTDYYGNSARYLGLAVSEKEEGRPAFSITEEGTRIMGLPFREKYLAIAAKIFEHEPFKRTFLEWAPTESITKERVCEIMQESNVQLEGTTIPRRASTIIGWCKRLKMKTEL